MKLENDMDVGNALYEAILNEFTSWKRTSESEVLRRLNSLKGVHPPDLLFANSLKAAFDTKLSHHLNYRDSLLNQNIFKECDAVFDEAFNFVTNSKSKAYKNNTRFLLVKLCFAIQISYGISGVIEFNTKFYERIWKTLQIVYADKKYFVFNIPYLILAKCLDLNIQSITYDDVIAYTMKTQIYDRSRGIKGAYTNIIQKYQGWNNLFQIWLNTFPVKNSNQFNYSFRQFLAYLDIHEFDDHPVNFMTAKRDVEFFEYLLSLPIKKKVDIHARIYRFTSWIVDEYLEGEGNYIATRSELDRFSRQSSQSNPLPFESTKEALPTAWIQKCKEILTENDHAWPKSLSWQYFDWRNPATNSLEKTWSPTSTYLFLMMLELPIRKIQAQQLDSGEGDTERFNLSKLCWEPNDHRHAGYWHNVNSLRNERGVITKLKPEGEVLAGIYINTNKTQDIKHAFNENSGYTIPWQNIDVIEIVDFMRNWNEIYNPVKGPLPFKETPTSCWASKPNKSALETIPDRFYLFRNPCGKHPEAPTSEANLFKFWRFLMLELERRLNAEGHNVKIILTYDQQHNPSSSFYTPHGLRVSGLTALYEKGVPIQILSKLVAGHASLVMTLHYIKYTPAHITSVLNKAQLQRDLDAQEDFLKSLNNSSSDEAKKFAVANSEEAIAIHHKRYEIGAKTSYGGSAIGLCPHNGTACDTGGPIIRKNGEKAPSHGPVEGGPNNCSRCRYLISGTPWLINIFLETNKKLADAHTASKQIIKDRDLISKLEKRKYELVKAEASKQEILSLQLEIQSVQNTLEAKSHHLDELLMTCHALHNLVEKIKAITNIKEDSGGYSLVVNQDNDDLIEYTVTSRLETINLLVQAGEIWKTYEDENLDRERTNFIDQVLFESGIRPISYSPLTNHEKKTAINDMANFLLANLTTVEQLQLEQKSITLADLGVCKKLESTMSFLKPIEASQSNVIKLVRKA
jgi:hypothetical protein